MDSQPENPSLPKGEIHFPNGNRASFVNAPSRADAAAVIAALQIPKPRTLLVLIGGADELDQNLTSQLDQLFSRGLARAAADTEALVMDGGTNAGVMALMGKAVADRGRATPLLGVAPAGKVTYPGGPADGSIAEGAPLDANHSHFVLVEGSEWSSGNEMMFKLANELGAGSTVITVLVNGGPATKDEVLRSVRQGWPIIVIQGSGRLADEIIELSKKGQTEDPVMTEIISEGNLLVFPLRGSPAELRKLLVSHIEDHLVEAWRRFGQYDSKAVSEQRWFRRTLLLTLMLGVLGTLFALLEKQLTGVSNLPPFLMSGLGYIVIAVPIVVSVFLTVSNRFKRDKKWILLRGSAEAVKKEIFRYRARIGDYGDQKISSILPPASREQVLVEKIATISRRLMETEANTASLPGYEDKPLPPRYSVAASDDGFSFLTPERYIEVRLADQLNYYNSKIRRLDRHLVRLQWAILTIGGVGTFLATVGAKVWIALTTAIVTALTAYVGQVQIEKTLVQYNQAAVDLSNLRIWWDSLPGIEKLKQQNRDMLVERSENILEGELAGWLQQIQQSPADQPDPGKKK